MYSPKGRILCAEDDEDTRDLFSFILTQKGFEVVFPEDVENCVSLSLCDRNVRSRG